MSICDIRGPKSCGKFSNHELGIELADRSDITQLKFRRSNLPILKPCFSQPAALLTGMPMHAFFTHAPE